MNFDDYQHAAARTSDPSQPTIDRVTNGALGLGGEAGEVIELVKKHRYHGKPLDREALVGELGDVLWYVAETASAAGLSLWGIAEENLSKLRARYPDGFEEGGGVRDLDWYLDEQTRETGERWPAACSTFVNVDPDEYPDQPGCDRCGWAKSAHG
jgi:NTP pyrophosphatase (non-canonical NTP hydrolase)